MNVLTACKKTHSVFFIPSWNNLFFQQLNSGILQQIEEYLQNGVCFSLSVSSACAVWARFRLDGQCSNGWALDNCCSAEPIKQQWIRTNHGIVFWFIFWEQEWSLEGRKWGRRKEKHLCRKPLTKGTRQPRKQNLQVSCPYLSPSLPSPLRQTLLHLVLEFPLNSQHNQDFCFRRFSTKFSLLPQPREKCRQDLGDVV